MKPNPRLAKIGAGLAGLTALLGAFTGLFGELGPLQHLVCGGGNNTWLCGRPPLPAVGYIQYCGDEEATAESLQHSLQQLGLYAGDPIGFRYASNMSEPGKNLSLITTTDSSDEKVQAGLWLAKKLSAPNHPWKFIVNKPLFFTEAQETQGFVFSVAGPSCEYSKTRDDRWKDEFFPSSPMGNEEVSGFSDSSIDYDKADAIDHMALWKMKWPNIHFELGEIYNPPLGKTGWIILVGKGLDPTRAEWAKSLWADYAGGQQWGNIYHVPQ